MYRNRLLQINLAVLLWVLPPVSSAFLPRPDASEPRNRDVLMFAPGQAAGPGNQGACATVSYALLMANAECMFFDARTFPLKINDCVQQNSCLF